MSTLKIVTSKNDVITWTSDGDGYTAFDVHPSGALFVYCGVDVPPAAVYSFGVWTVLETS